MVRRHVKLSFTRLSPSLLPMAKGFRRATRVTREKRREEKRRDEQLLHSLLFSEMGRLLSKGFKRFKVLLMAFPFPFL